MLTPEAVCNAALDAIGYKRHIGSLWEGSPASRVALDVYSQTRATLLAQVRPEWARKDAVLTLLKSAPADGYQTTNWDPVTNPAFPWLYEYAEPSDELVPLQIKPRPFTALPLWRPRYVPFREAISTTTGNNVILTNQVNAVLTYIVDVTDPAKWHDTYTAAMISALAQQFQPLVGAPAKEPERADAS